MSDFRKTFEDSRDNVVPDSADRSIGMTPGAFGAALAAKADGVTFRKSLENTFEHTQTFDM